LHTTSASAPARHEKKDPLVTNRELALRRLAQHRLAGAPCQTAAEAVAWMGAMQGQEYLSARWAVGLRCAGLDEAAVEQAIASGRVVRTWAMRGTFQFVAAEDVRWLAAVVGPPALARHAPAQRKLGVDEAAYARAEPVLLKLLEGQALTRAALFAALERHGISTAGQRGYYYLVQAALRGRLCLGPLQGKQETYVRVDDWVPTAPALPREQGLAELARRYVFSHGPATLADFAWWAGLTRTEARAGLEGARAALAEEVIDGKSYWAPRHVLRGQPEPAYLLPAFDELVLGYADRAAALKPQHSPRVLSSNGLFYPTLVCDGQVVGTWKRTLKKDSVAIALRPFGALSRAQRQAVEAAAERYGTFLCLKPVINIG
jgi:hypothetical protein